MPLMWLEIARLPMKNIQLCSPHKTLSSTPQKTLIFAASKQMEMLADILKKTPGFDNTYTAGNVSKSL